MACPTEIENVMPCMPTAKWPLVYTVWLRNYIKIFSDLMQKLNLSNIMENLYFGIFTVTKL